MLIRQQQGTTQTARYIFAGGDYSLGKTLPGHGAPHNANQQQNEHGSLDYGLTQPECRRRQYRREGEFLAESRFMLPGVRKTLR